ncbi:hypothetical protein Tco_0020127 [Tanacetum coccineum]
MFLRQKFSHLNIPTEESLYDPLNGSLPTLSSSNASATQANKLPGSSTHSTMRQATTHNRRPLSDVTNLSQRAVVCNTQVGVLPNSWPTSGDRVNPVVATRKRQTPLNDISNGINTILENNAWQTTNVGTSSSGRVSLTAQKGTNVATRPSACVPKRTPNSQNPFVSQTTNVCNMHIGVVPNSLATSGDQITPIAATRKWQTPLNDSSRVSPSEILCNTINNVNRSILASNSWPLSGNPVTLVAAATRNLHSPLTDVSNVALQTPVVDDLINRRGRGPYVFRLHGQTYHSMGSLIPKEGTPPKFTQMYIYDTENEVENRARALSNSSPSSAPSKSEHPIDRDIIRQVKDVLDTSSDLFKTFRRARDRYSEDSEQNIQIKLVAKQGMDGRTYNLPTTNEVVGLIVGEFDTCVEQRDIVIEKHREGLERISIFHPLYLPLQYPLLMPCGQDGYHLKIPHRKKSGQPTTGKKDKMVTMWEWFAYQIQDRLNQENLYSKLRCDTYSNIRQSVAEGNTNPTLLGKPVVLSSSFTRRPRYMQAHKLSSTDRPDVMSRVFKMKLDQLMKDIKDLCLFGRTQADKNEDPDLYKLVFDFMMHGLCGEDDTTQAAWRIFGFETHYRTLYVERLSFHLTGEQQVLYDEYSDLETVMHKPSVGQSLLEDDKEYVDSIKDVAHWAPAEHLHMIISDDEKRNVYLFYIEELLRSRGCCLRNWPKMPYPDNRYIIEFGNQLIYDETDYNHVELQTEYERLYASLTTE